VIDRLIQQSHLTSLDPIFDPSFSESSFGFRTQIDLHMERPRQIQHTIRAAIAGCVDMTFSKFFESSSATMS